MEPTSTTPRSRFTDLNLLAVPLRLGSFSGEMLGWGFFEPRWWRNYLHVHSFFEICYAFEGCGTFRMLGADYPVEAGQVFVAKPGEPHEIISSDERPLGIYFWSYTLVPPGSPAAEARGIDALLHAFLTSRRWVSDRAPDMERVLLLLTEEIVARRPGYPQSIEGLVAKLLIDTARAVVDPAPGEVGDTAARNPAAIAVQRVMRYLRDNYGRPLTIRDAAAQVHLSERHISRLFRAAMGVSIMDYLTSLRIEAAGQLLLERQLSIKEVAEASGYPDVHYFTTLFRRRTGLTPASFRRQGGTRFLDQ
jgi:AraC family L-rhamnose operon transcriptional activator RhaR